MNQRENVENVLRKFIEAGLVEKNMEKILSCITDDLHGFGMGEQGIVNSKYDVIRVLETGIKDNDDASYKIVFESMDTQVYSYDFATICAVIRVECTKDDEVSYSKFLQSATLRMEDNQWLICEIHASPVIVSAESVEAYPLKFVENTLIQLKAEIQSKAFELLNQSIPGGLMSVYLDEGYPLYFINNSMLKYLGYTYDEFISKINGLVVNCIHIDDRQYVKDSINNALQKGEEFEFRHRIIKSDGSAIWVIDRGRKGKAENGKDVLVSVYVDITEIMFLQSELEEKAEALQAKNIELNSLTNNVPGGVCAMRMDSRLTLVYANSYFYELCGYTESSFSIELKNEWASCICCDDVERVINTVLEAYKTNKSHFEFEIQIEKKDREILWVLVRGGFIELSNDTNAHCVVIDITRRKQMEQALMLSEERFRIALEKTSNIIFDYDIKKGKITHSSAPRKSLGFHTNIQDASTALLLGGEILSAYIDEFSQAFERIRSGEKQSECVVKTHLLNGKDSWSKISMTSIFDNQGCPVRAVGIIEDITLQKETELAYIREEQYSKAFLANAMASYVINFTNDEFESCKVDSPICVEPRDGEPYNDYLFKVINEHLNIDDRHKFILIFSRQRILEAFERGKFELKLEYRAVTPDGGELWVLTTLRLLLDSVTHDMKGFMYVMDIDERKKEELLLTYKSERDPLTGLYNKSISRIKIDEMLNTNEGRNTGVFIMIDVDRFKNINDIYGHPFGDNVLMSVAKGISALFRQRDIVGRLGGDEFAVFFCGVRTKRRINEIVEDICNVFRNVFTDEFGKPGTTCSIGIATCNGEIKPFEQLYKEADIALYAVKKKGRNGYMFFSDVL